MTVAAVPAVWRATVAAPAKLNLGLAVLARTADGYHDIESVMINVALADSLSLHAEWTSFGSATDVSLQVRGGGSQVPSDDRNLVLRAAHAWLAEVERRRSAGAGDPHLPSQLAFTLVKRVPAEAGLGGGSADAAAALRLLSAVPNVHVPPEALYDIAAHTGSDVPFALLGGAAHAAGRGERLTAVPAPRAFWVVLVQPPLSVSTAWCYQRWDELCLASADADLPRKDAALSGIVEGVAAGNAALVGRHLFNDLESPVLDRHPEVAAIMQVLTDAGCVGARMTGSGSCFFGLAATRSAARQAADAARRSGLGRVWITRTLVSPLAAHSHDGGTV